MSSSELVLASGSSRRRQLLENLNIRYSTCVPDVDESLKNGEAATHFVDRMAASKARAAAVLDSNLPILAADTIISINDEVIGKPKSVQEAESTLHKLSAKQHVVITGVCLIHAEHEYQIRVLTKVKFKCLSNHEINDYCLSDEPYDKAGAYAIQGNAARFVEYVSGSYTNVIGLPVHEVCQLFKRVNL